MSARETAIEALLGLLDRATIVLNTFASKGTPSKYEMDRLSEATERAAQAVRASRSEPTEDQIRADERAKVEREIDQWLTRNEMFLEVGHPPAQTYDAAWLLAGVTAAHREIKRAIKAGDYRRDGS